MRRVTVLIGLFIVGLVLPVSSPVIAQTGEIIALRTETSKTYGLGGGMYRMISGGPLHYQDSFGNWQSGFLDLTKQHGAIADDLPDRLIFSVSKLRKMIASLKGKKKTDAQKDYEELRELAGAKVLARFTNSQKMIELARPLPEGEQV